MPELMLNSKVTADLHRICLSTEVKKATEKNPVWVNLLGKNLNLGIYIDGIAVADNFNSYFNETYDFTQEEIDKLDKQKVGVLLLYGNNIKFLDKNDKSLITTSDTLKEEGPKTYRLK